MKPLEESKWKKEVFEAICDLLNQIAQMPIEEKITIATPHLTPEEAKELQKQLDQMPR